jgi:hypothetical protein
MASGTEKTAQVNIKNAAEVSKLLFELMTAWNDIAVSEQSHNDPNAKLSMQLTHSLMRARKYAANLAIATGEKVE